jgi:hypothetical protein
MPNPIPARSRILVRARDFFRCVRCGCGVPAGVGHWHHRRGKSVRDDHTHEGCNGIWLCSACHTWVHANPLLARLSGWIVSRHSNPCTVPVVAAQHGRVLLDHFGGVTPTEEE